MDWAGSEHAGAVDVAQATVQTWQDILSRVGPIVGHRGVAAVYRRSVRLTGHAHPWLAVAAQDGASEPDLAVLETTLSARPRGEAAAAADALLQNLRELLSSLLGQSLTERLLSPVWSQPLAPEDSRDVAA